VGDRIEVLWNIADAQEEVDVWWPAVVQQRGASYILAYEAEGEFSAEVRQVNFLGPDLLWDVKDARSTPWRRDGDESESESEAEGEFPLGCHVKVRLEDRSYAGVVCSRNEDGTVDVLTEGITKENEEVIAEGVPLDKLEKVEMPEAARQELRRSDSEVSDFSTFDDFYNQFVRSITSGPSFTRLPAAAQALFAEKVNSLRPHFEREVIALRDERGIGSVLTGADVKEIMPRVMACLA